MSIKKFVVILVLSIGVWYVSGIIQAILGILFGSTPVTFFSPTYLVTGYPLAYRVSEYDSNTVAPIIIINISFWLIILLTLNFLYSRRIKGKKRN